MDREQEGRSIERRGLTEPVEVREEADGVRVVGYAALYNSRSVILPGGFQEIIRPGAFDRSLENPETDVVALWNHDENFLLGRQSSGTLKLWADERGLMYSVLMPSSRADVLEAVRRGDAKGSSFAFTVERDGEEYERSEDGGPPLRYISKVKGLYDVSVVVHPAYPETTAAVRQRAAEFAEPVKHEPEPVPARISPLARAAHVARWLRREF
jgi:HK97 family phage prohead protease